MKVHQVSKTCYIIRQSDYSSHSILFDRDSARRIEGLSVKSRSMHMNITSSQSICLLSMTALRPKSLESAGFRAFSDFPSYDSICLFEFRLRGNNFMNNQITLQVHARDSQNRNTSRLQRRRRPVNATILSRQGEDTILDSSGTCGSCLVHSIARHSIPAKPTYLTLTM